MTVAAPVDVNSALREVDETTRAAFLIWHKLHPQVWKEFEKFALQGASRGRRMGAKMIGERIRWETQIERGEEFKVNNNFLSYMARIFTAKYPEYSQLFEFREVRGLKEAA